MCYNINDMKKALISVLIFVVLGAFAALFAAEIGEWWAKEGEPPYQDGADSPLLASYPGGLVVDWGRKVAIIKGRVGLNGPLSVENREKLKQTALYDAVDSLLLTLGLVRYDGFTRIADLYDRYLSLQSDMNKLVKKTYRTVCEKVYEKENMLEITFEFDLVGKKGLSGLIFPIVLGDAPSPISYEGSSAPSPEIFSGLIVDASNLGVEGGLSPNIYDEKGNKVYSLTKGINKSALILGGLQDYAISTFATQEEVARAGANPLCITAKSRLKSPFGCDIVISNVDAEKIRAADAASGFIKDLKVVILL